MVTTNGMVIAVVIVDCDGREVASGDGMLTIVIFTNGGRRMTYF